MARPTKQGLEYFPMDVDADTDEALEYVIAKRGFIAFGVYVRLLMGIYKDGYYTEWNERKLFVYAKRMMMDTETLSAIISDFVTAGLFSQEMLAKGILTSASIQKRYLAATEKRKTAGIAEEYDLISDVINSEKTPAEKELIPKKLQQKEINSELMPQSKVKESKVNNNNNNNTLTAEEENLSKVVGMYEGIVGQPVRSQIERELLIELIDNYTLDNIQAAFREAARAGAKGKNLRYIEGILKNWANGITKNKDSPRPTLSAEEKAARDRQRAEEKERYEAAERERVFREYGVVVNESA
jgi:DNA replication protein DnaD